MAVLYVVAMPIGNLQDFSPRGIETLKTADLIAAEDTRVTMKLCQVFDIHTRLTSCHQHNEERISEALAERILREDLTCALTTDAGTPGISDPGHELVRACAEKGIPVIPVPGCCAGAAAVSAAGFDAREFAFYGFLPREKKALREKLRQMARGPAVAVVHESPFRILDLTEAIRETLPEARLALCSDLTKMHERIYRGGPEEILEALRQNPNAEKGEYCLVLDFHGIPPEEEKAPAAESLEGRIIEEMKRGASLREAQEALIAAGEKKNAVKQAALTLRRLFETEE